MENERLRITLENPKKMYTAGQTIKGSIWLNFTKRTKIRAIKIQITGKGKCKWMEILRKNSNANNETTRGLFYSSKEIYAHNEIPLTMFEPRGMELSSGEHSFNFAMPLEPFLPSSFKGSHGSIKYKLRILIQKPWSFDERHSIPVTIIKNMTLPPVYLLNTRPLEKQTTKTISLFGTRLISMLASLPNDFAVLGDPLRVCVTVTNNTTLNVEKLRFSVLQYISYYSNVPLRIKKEEIIPIVHKETGAVQKRSERSFAHELLIPESVQPSDDEFSGIINIAYELRVEAVLRGFYKNIIINLPFKIYTKTEADVPHPPNAPEISNSAGNPFEQSSESITMYPPLDGCTVSPSHSSQHGSESSSLHSTISDSSATTLSPAVGGTFFSYTSGSSSQYNSPINRSSLRSNSNVPYMPYSNSPLINSYPPLLGHLPVYPDADLTQGSMVQQRPVPSQGTPTPPSGSSTMSSSYYESDSSVTYMPMQSRLGAQELPPSYEELFGNATAPPETSK